MKIRRLFVANRGEIAVRILRTAKRLGIETVLGASDIDLDSVPARLADRCVRLGPSAAAKSYLDVAAVVGAARSAGADALHPGYGFLSENSALPRACELAGITFVGPTAATLDAVGDKLAARRHAAGAGLPIVPGGEATSIDEAAAAAAACGVWIERRICSLSWNSRSRRPMPRLRIPEYTSNGSYPRVGT